MSISRNVFAPGLDVESLARALTAWLQVQKLEVQRVPGHTVVLQCRERQPWRKFVGMATALQVELGFSDPGLAVQIGAGEWRDKAIVGGVVGGVAVAAHVLWPLALAAHVLWPLAVPAAFGYYQQRRLPDRVMAFIEELVGVQCIIDPPGPLVELGGGRGDPIGPPKTVLCPQCAKSNPFDAIFCANCRASLQPELVPPAYPSEDELVLSDYDREQKGSTNGIPRTSVTQSDNKSHWGRHSHPMAGSTPRIDAALVCSQCGRRATQGKQFCGNCGLPLKPRGVGSTVPSGGGDPGTTGSSRSAATLAGSDGRATPARKTLGGVVLIVDEGGQRIAVPDKREALIGRRGRANGSFPDIDLTVHKAEACGVSREHARLLLRDGDVALEDLGSPNCTWVGDKQLIPGTPQPLRNGERLRFGTLAATIQFP